LTSTLGRFRHRSLLAWSCGQSDTLPLFRTIDHLPADNSSVGLFTNLSRYYAVQSVKVTKETKLERQQSNETSECHVDVESSDAAADVNIHSVQSYSDNSVSAAAKCEKHEQQQSDRAIDIQQTVVDSSEMVTQTETNDKLGLMQRFRMMYKQYGVVLVGMHAVTSSVWVGLFYCATVR